MYPKSYQPNSIRQVECLLCGGLAELKHNRYPGYRQPDIFQIYHCPDCHAAFALPQVETSSIYENIYDNGKIVPGYNRYWKYAENIKKSRNPMAYLANQEEAYWAVKEATASQITNKEYAKILEVGCGLGYLTYALAREGYNIVGLEISETAVANARMNFGDHFICSDLFQFAQLNSGSFDMVILTEVLEHVENPMDFLVAILKLLKSGGKAIITSPNKSIYPKEIIWDTELPPVHYWWLSEKTMKVLAKKTNTQITFTNFSNYYNNKRLEVEVNRQLDGKLPVPILNKDGRLIDQTIADEKHNNTNWRSMVLHVPFIRNIYFKLKKMKRPGNYVCDERGIVFCAILQKQ